MKRPPVRFGFVEGGTLTSLCVSPGLVLAESNWLIVALDSARGPDLWKARPYVGPQLESSEIGYRWREEGIWIGGTDVPRLLAREGIMVPFSATYIFPNTITTCLPPRYTATSETDQFKDEVPEAAIEELERIGAHGYVADGVGLNYALLAEDLYELVRGLVEGNQT